MFKLSYGHGSDSILTAEQVASSIYDNIDVETGGFICARMAYMSNFREAIKFTSEEELVQALNQYINQHDTEYFDYSKLQICYRAPGRKWTPDGTTIETSTLFKIEFEIPQNKSINSSDILHQAKAASPKELAVFKKLHPQKKNDPITTQEPAKTFLTK